MPDLLSAFSNDDNSKIRSTQIARSDLLGDSNHREGNLEHLRLQNIRRRTEFARRMAEAPTSSLARVYLKSIQELDATWVYFTGTAPPEFSEPVAPAAESSGTDADTQGPITAAAEKGPNPELHPTSLSDPIA